LRKWFSVAKVSDGWIEDLKKRNKVEHLKDLPWSAVNKIKQSLMEKNRLAFDDEDNAYNPSEEFKSQLELARENDEEEI